MEELRKQLNFEFVSRVLSTSVSVTSLNSDQVLGMPGSSKSEGSRISSTDERGEVSQGIIMKRNDGQASRSTSGSSSSSTWLIDLDEEAAEGTRPMIMGRSGMRTQEHKSLMDYIE